MMRTSYEGPLPWYRINNEMRTLSFKLPGFIGITVPFAKDLDERIIEEVVREKISGYDRFLPDEFQDNYRNKYTLISEEEYAKL